MTNRLSIFHQQDSILDFSRVPIEVSSLSKSNGGHSGDALLTLNDEDNALKENLKRNDIQTDQS